METWTVVTFAPLQTLAVVRKENLKKLLRPHVWEECATKEEALAVTERIFGRAPHRVED